MVKLPEEIVSAGTYLIVDKEVRYLTAHLGTSVGIAIFDKAAGVGGIMHAVLAEPTTSHTTLNQINYARDGIPYFIEKLEEAGASRDSMQAAIAGGSLIGEVTSLDMDIDIGGKTATIAAETLKEQNIPIIKSETGGYFGSKISLHTGTWELDFQPIVQVDEPNPDYRRPTADEIGEAIGKIKPIPQIALKIINLVRSKGYNMSEISKEISLDQVISAKVLRLCNSALIGLSKTVDSVDRALVILGENQLLEVVVSAAVDTYFIQPQGGYSLRKGGLYQHSLGTAVVSKTIAKLTKKVDPSTAYTAGLLHDIGKVVLDQYIDEIFPMFYQGSHLKRKNFRDLERELLGTDHNEVGMRLAKAWKLPENLISVIENHGNPEDAGEHSDLVHTVYFGDLIASWFQAGMEMEHMNTNHLQTRLETAGLNAGLLPVVIDRVPWSSLAEN